MNNVQREFPLYARLRADYRLTDALVVGTGLKADIRLLAEEPCYFKCIKKYFIDFRIGYSFKNIEVVRGILQKAFFL
jgi:hypothetical protein